MTSVHQRSELRELAETIRFGLKGYPQPDAEAALDAFVDLFEDLVIRADERSIAGAEALKWIAATYPKVMDRMPRALFRALRETNV